MLTHRTSSRVSQLKDWVGEIRLGILTRKDPVRGWLFDFDKAERVEGIMPPGEEVPTEHYRVGQRLRVYVYDVRRIPGRMLQIMVSRTHRDLVRRLFESEVPEIYEGTVEIKAIAREPGSRSKVAVVARQEGLDPIGSYRAGYSSGEATLASHRKRWSKRQTCGKAHRVAC